MASPHRIWDPTMNAGNAFSSQLYASIELERLRPRPLDRLRARHARAQRRAGGPGRASGSVQAGPLLPEAMTALLGARGAVAREAQPVAAASLAMAAL